MRYLLLALSLLLVPSCASRSRQQLTVVSSQLSGVRSLSVRSSSARVPWMLEAELLNRLSLCDQAITSEPHEEADLVIDWEAAPNDFICIHTWFPGCDAQRARATLLFQDGTRAEWSRRRPGWCQIRDCLRKLFADDLKHFICSASNRTSCFTGDVGSAGRRRVSFRLLGVDGLKGEDSIQ